MIVYPCVEYLLPFGVHLSDGVYDVRIGGASYRLRIRVVPSDRSAWKMQSGILATQHDIFGRLTRSDIVVVFIEQPIRTSQDVLTEEHLKTVHDERRIDADSLVDAAVEVGDRLLQVCRDQLMEAGAPAFHLAPVNALDIGDFHIGLTDEDFSPPLFPYRTGYVLRSPFHALALGNSSVRVDSEASIREMLLKGTPIPSWRVLWRSAQNRLWRSEFYMVPVEVNVAFEVVVEQTVRDLAKRVGDEFKEELRFLDRLSRIQKRANDLRIAADQAPLYWTPETGWKDFDLITEVLEVKNWYYSCYLLRCKVVHEGFIHVTHCQAEAALSATSSALAFIQQLEL